MTELEKRMLIPDSAIAELDRLQKQLNNLSIRRPQSVQEAQMHARKADFLELMEQEYIRGWTDCEEDNRIDLKTWSDYAKLPEAYKAGFSDCYEYENQSDRYAQDNNIDAYGEDLG